MVAQRVTGGSTAVLSPAEAAGVYCDNLVKIYKISTLEVVALQGLNLRIEPGEMVGIVGKSGSGKSTLLNILGGHDLPSAGKVRVAGKDLLRMSERDMTRYRRFTVGFIWQQTARNLLPYASARRNVEHVLLFAGVTGGAARKRSDELLELVGLKERRQNKPNELSGGEQQRVAIAVALANHPKVILADEPTGELDSQTASDILGVLKQLNRELKVTTVVVTHDPTIAQAADRVVAIRDGRTATESVRVEHSNDDVEHEEYLVVDPTGRLQLPFDYVKALGINGRARVHLEGDRIILQRG